MPTQDTRAQLVAAPSYYITECNVCGKEYRNGVGSTECCGAIQPVKYYHYSEVQKLREALAHQLPAQPTVSSETLGFLEAAEGAMPDLLVTDNLSGGWKCLCCDRESNRAIFEHAPDCIITRCRAAIAAERERAARLNEMDDAILGGVKRQGEVIAELRAKLAAATTWLPIADAPRDGSKLVLKAHYPRDEFYYPYIGRFDTAYGEWMISGTNTVIVPTHFMPIPPMEGGAK